jgi:hypothetical protein
MICNKDVDWKHADLGPLYNVTRIPADELQIIKVAFNAFQRSGKCAFPFTSEALTELLDRAVNRFRFGML